jgi:hypothetical protein
MPGPVPKNPIVRQRRNRSSTRALLPAERSPIRYTPRLPKNPLGAWDPFTKEWWKNVWTSPIHHEFLRADLGALFRLAILVDLFWKTGKLEAAKEIRLLEREFGLTPLSRRRLEWSVAQSEEAIDRHEQKRVKRAFVINGDDPREVLR